MCPARRWPVDTDPLVYELEIVRKKSIHAFKRPGLNDTLPLLRARGQELYPQIPIAAGLFVPLNTLLGRAISNLEVPEDLPVAHRYSIDPEDHTGAVYILLGIEQSPSLTLAQRQAAAADQYGIATITANVFRQQLEQRIIIDLARCIAELEAEAERPPQPEGQYVARPALHAGAKSILDRKRKLVLVGEPGTGKTVMATLLARETNPEGYFIIRSGKHFVDDVLTMLDRYSVRPGGSEAVHRRQLARLMTEQSHAVIVFDGVSDWDEIGQFINDNTACQVIVTSNRMPPAPIGQEYSARVRNMHPGEAVQMARLYAPRFSEEQAQRLTRAVHCRPIAIAHACGFLQADDVHDIDIFITSLEARTTLILDSAAVVTEQSLRMIYEETLKELETTHPQAAALLGFLAFTEALSAARMEATEGVAYIMMQLGLFARELTGSDLETGIMACLKAERVLVHRFLIDRRATTTYIHPLTARIFRDILESERERINADVGKIINAAMMGAVLEFAKAKFTENPELLDPQRPQPQATPQPDDISNSVVYIMRQLDELNAGNVSPEDRRLIKFMLWASEAVLDQEVERLSE